ncbi:MAG: DNA adenine methylase [Myxococcota bacterium]|nr:DNA adenine methylase [Myxococcota bacterium]
MLTRYLGNKTRLLGPILEEVGRCVPLSERPRVGDFFAGTMSVALALKAAGCRVAANDVQAFSGIVGEAFVLNDTVPAVPPNLVPRRAQNDALDALVGTDGFHCLAHHSHRQAYARILDVLDYLASLGEPADGTKSPSYFFDTYTEQGANSAFQSRRGSSGRRRFFTPENGRRIDRVMNQLRMWWQSGLINRALYTLLVSCMLRAVEKVSNTQGTYHDFPRDRYDRRALNPLTFEPPPMDQLLVGGTHHIAVGDALVFAKTVTGLDILYLDPPYNFRQYTAYYFLPNLMARYGEMSQAQLRDWFAGVQYVRGQNMADDFQSSFCRKTTFIQDLGRLVDSCRPRYVILSYFDGRNHWHTHQHDDQGVGQAKLNAFFETSRFDCNVRVRPINRQNYQSHGGHPSRKVLEFLYVAKTTW